ncbi:MAG: DUF4286 family protein [Bacteroidetes bacterium]|nr:DUF4286 family protein [Bacteroidota bacterium]
MKILYEINIQVRKEKEIDWVTWISDDHIPAICEVARVSDAFLIKIDGPDSDTFSAYRVMFYFDDKSDLTHYLDNFAAPLRDDHIKKFGNDVSIQRQYGIVMKWFEITAPKG